MSRLRSRIAFFIRAMSSTAAFSPSSLFANNEPGGWYDPSDLSTLFQDSAGTTPVTAPGQTVGLWLDKSRGLVLGSELQPNGNFANAFTSWTPGSAWSVVSGRAYLNYTGTGSILAGSFTPVVGSTYLLTFDYEHGSGANIARIGGTEYNIPAATGTYTVRLRAATTATLQFTTNSGTAQYYVDNISVKELPGNHLSQSSSGQRAIYGVEPIGGRRNLLTYTEQFDNAAWTKDACTVSQNAAVAPDGTTTADKVVSSNATAQMGVGQSFTASATTYTASFYAKASEVQFVQILWTSSRSTDYANFDLVNGTVTASVGSASITSVGNGWYRIALASTLSAGAATAYCWMIGSGSAARAASYVGNGINGFFPWGAQLETGSTATAYQRVVTAFDVTEAGVPSLSYIQFDGSDDGYVSPTITPGIDKAQVFAGVRKLSDAAIGVVLESSASIGSNNGAVAIYAPTSNGTATYQWLTKGTVFSLAPSLANYASPITNVLTGIGDIAADTAILRVNGTQVATSTTDQGTGNYLAYPLYVGRRGGTVLPLNGRIYSLIVRFGANLSASTITQTENWVAGKTGIYTLEQLSRLNAQTADGTLYSAYAASDAQSNNYLVNNTVLAADGTSYNVI